MVKKFDFNKHYRMLCSWWAKRDMAPIPEDMIPTFGLVVDNIAAGFIIVTDCNLGFLEFYISNKDAQKIERDLALDLITRGLMEHGQEMGISNFKCDTQIHAIKKRAEKFGFKNIGEFSNYFLSVRG